MPVAGRSIKLSSGALVVPVLCAEAADASVNASNIDKAFMVEVELQYTSKRSEKVIQNVSNQ